MEQASLDLGGDAVVPRRRAQRRPGRSRQAGDATPRQMSFTFSDAAGAAAPRAVRGPAEPVAGAARRRGQVAHLVGAGAEAQVAAQYVRGGATLVETRWRGRCGEIDLILNDGRHWIFVEVKRARSHDRAAERLTPRQVGRIRGAVAEYMAARPNRVPSEARFDLALVDGTGRIEIRPNVLA